MNEISFPAVADLDPGSEEAHLLRSPANAARLLAALNQALRGEGEPISIDNLEREVGLADDS